MTKHNYANLSPYDFEVLVGQLIEARHGEGIESFTAGRDQGIDLRFRGGTVEEVIIQCKHLPNEKFPSLLSKLKSELPKIQALKPRRYAVATTVGLTPANKSLIKDLFHPYIWSTRDIWGRESIDALLRVHKAVETETYKLWFASAAVMTRILHAAEHLDAQFKVQNLARMLPRFVQSDSFPRARDILEDTRIVIISGPPGIGKSTLADLLLADYLERGYQPIVITDSVRSAKKVFDPSRKQIVHFDDFLGETFLGDLPLSASQDAELLAFMDAVRHSPNSRFILATRENILRVAMQTSERLGHSNILSHRAVLDLRSYSRRQKAHILYNHLYFGTLPGVFRNALLEDRGYLKIVDHRNYSPRLIHYLTDYLSAVVAPDDYLAHAIDTLNHPERVWKHAFERQLSEASKSLLIALAASGSSARTMDLEPDWERLHSYRAARYNIQRSSGEFRRAIDELEGSFTTTSNANIRVTNPSVRDFLNLVLKTNGDFARDLLLAAGRFNQVYYLMQLSTQTPSAGVREIIRANVAKIVSMAGEALHGPHMRWFIDDDGVNTGIFIDSPPERKVLYLLDWAERLRSEDLLRIAGSAASEICSGRWGDGRHRVDLNLAIAVIDTMPHRPWSGARGANEILVELKAMVLRELPNATCETWEALRRGDQHIAWTADEWATIDEVYEVYLDQGIFEEIADQELLSDLNDMAYYVERLGMYDNTDISSALSAIKRRISSMEAELLPEEDDEDEPLIPFSSSPNVEGNSTDDAIASLFGTLKSEESAG